MKIAEKQLAGASLLLFRIWLYAPFPLMFLSLGINLLLLRFPSSFGTVGFVLCTLTALGIVYAIRRFEMKVGHSNLDFKTVILGFSVTVVMMIAWPLALYIVHLIRLDGSIRPVDLHLQMSFMTAGIVPIALMAMARMKQESS